MRENCCTRVFLSLLLCFMVSFVAIPNLSSHQSSIDEEIEVDLTLILRDSNFTIEGSTCSPIGTTGVLTIEIAPEEGMYRGYRVTEWKIESSRYLDDALAEGCVGSATITLPVAPSYEVQIRESGVHVISHDQVAYDDGLLLVWNDEGIFVGQPGNSSSVVAAPSPTPLPDPAFLLRNTGAKYVIEAFFFGPRDEYLSVFSYKFESDSAMHQTFDAICTAAETDVESAPYSSPVSIGRPGEYVCAFGSSGGVKAVVGCNGSLFAVRADTSLAKLSEILTVWCDRANESPDELVPALADLPIGWSTLDEPTFHEGMID